MERRGNYLNVKFNSSKTYLRTSTTRARISAFPLLGFAKILLHLKHFTIVQILLKII